ncbi:hypothetical protein PoMZ_10163 [Pyricularia oryzae]|uniref:Uncharacterized protein n=1 Tax=Pyricularia oryzae TaxID=318829 RepID=A0A4P7MWY4_PYROR|nr:hypothetical protein PoMZ_10163 [Pyricularia oryzae]
MNVGHILRRLFNQSWLRETAVARGQESSSVAGWNIVRIIGPPAASSRVRLS